MSTAIQYHSTVSNKIADISMKLAKGYLALNIAIIFVLYLANEFHWNLLSLAHAGFFTSKLFAIPLAGFLFNLMYIAWHKAKSKLIK